MADQGDSAGDGSGKLKGGEFCSRDGVKVVSDWQNRAGVKTGIVRVNPEKSICQTPKARCDATTDAMSWIVLVLYTHTVITVFFLKRLGLRGKQATNRCQPARTTHIRNHRLKPRK